MKLQELQVNGIKITSRYDVRSELVATMNALAEVTAQRELEITSIWCDSKIGNSFVVQVNFEDQRRAGLLCLEMHCALCRAMEFGCTVTVKHDDTTLAERDGDDRSDPIEALMEAVRGDLRLPELPSVSLPLPPDLMLQVDRCVVAELMQEWVYASAEAASQGLSDLYPPPSEFRRAQVQAIVEGKVTDRAKVEDVIAELSKEVNWVKYIHNRRKEHLTERRH